MDFNKPHSASAIIQPKKSLLVRKNLKKFINLLMQGDEEKLNESFIMSILETEDTEPGPGYFDPDFDFY